MVTWRSDRLATSTSLARGAARVGGLTLTFSLEISESSEQLVRLARGCLLIPVMYLLCILPGSIHGELGGSSLGLHRIVFHVDVCGLQRFDDFADDDTMYSQALLAQCTT